MFDAIGNISFAPYHTESIKYLAFSHPDYTVGTGISPVQPELADFTAGVESHQPPKTFFICLTNTPRRRA